MACRQMLTFSLSHMLCLISKAGVSPEPIRRHSGGKVIAVQLMCVSTGCSRCCFSFELHADRSNESVLIWEHLVCVCAVKQEYAMRFQINVNIEYCHHFASRV